jgi:hypothetical protein
MSTLARFAGLLALFGGAVWVIANLIQMADPLSYAWIGLFASSLLIGGAALGLQRQFGARTGMLGRWGAAATAAGSVALLAFLLFIVASGQIYATTPPPDILVALTLLSLLLWLVGSVVFALGLMRAKAISPIAGWLIVLGAVVSPVSLIAGGQNPPPFVYLPFVMYGIGWVLVGYAARTTPADLGVAGQAS